LLTDEKQPPDREALLKAVITLMTQVGANEEWLSKTELHPATAEPVRFARRNPDKGLRAAAPT